MTKEDKEFLQDIFENYLTGKECSFGFSGEKTLETYKIELETYKIERESVKDFYNYMINVIDNYE